MTKRRRVELVIDVTAIKQLLRDLLRSGLWGDSLEEVCDRLMGAAIVDMQARGIVFPSDLAREARRAKRGK